MRTPVSRRSRNVLATSIAAMALLGSASSARGQCAFGELLDRDELRRVNDFGTAVAISGNRALVGAPIHCSPTCGGAVFSFQFDGTVWVEDGTLVSNDLTQDDRFGSQVAMSDDVAVIGMHGYARCNTGAVYIFGRTGGEWVQQMKLTASDSACEDQFGQALAYDGVTLVVGARTHGGVGEDTGAAYVFRRNGLDWIEEAKLRPVGLETGDSFGSSVSVLGDVIAVGAAGDDDQDENAGAAFVFRWNGAEWVEEAKIVGSMAGLNDNVADVSIGNGFLLLGSPHADIAHTNSGIVQVFRDTGTQWVEQTTLEAALPTEQGRFGSSLLNQDDLVIIGADNDIASGVEAGAVYVYQWTESDVAFETMVLPAVPVDARGFGRSSSISGDFLLVGAPTWGSTPFEFPISAEVILLADSPVGTDCNANAIDDSCEIFTGSSPDCNENLVPDECDIGLETSDDCNANGVPDECEPDCNNNGIADICDIADATSVDCNANGVPDACDLANASSPDCNVNDTPDECDVAADTSVDCNENEVPDECEATADCNTNGVQDICEIFDGSSDDCNFDLVPDECQPDEDCNENGTRDICDIGAETSDDCNTNLVPDLCDLSSGESVDNDGDGRPDVCCFVSPDPPAIDRLPDSAGILRDNKKGRMIPIIVNDVGRLSAIQVEFVDLPAPYDLWNGTKLFARAPIDVCESAVIQAGECFTTTYVTSKLECTDTPFFADWNALGVVNVWHEGIVPDGTYNVRVIDETCGPSLATNYSEPTGMQTAIFGDTVSYAGFQYPVDNAVGIIDALGGLAVFSGVPGRPSKSRTDLTGRCIDFYAGIEDVLYSLLAFTGGHYRDTPSTDDPCDSLCPDPRQ